jgi:hypothetical protein
MDQESAYGIAHNGAIERRGDGVDYNCIHCDQILGKMGIESRYMVVKTLGK